MRSLAAIILFAIAACAKAPDAVPARVACQNPLAGCQIYSGVEVRFSNTPTTMQAFELVVTAPEGGDVYASFQMQGMDMGMNRYRLLRENGKWRAKVMLPACVQGRRDWLLRLELSGKNYEISFAAG